MSSSTDKCVLTIFALLGAWVGGTLGSLPPVGGHPSVKHPAQGLTSEGTQRDNMTAWRLGPWPVCGLCGFTLPSAS